MVGPRNSSLPRVSDRATGQSTVTFLRLVICLSIPRSISRRSKTQNKRNSIERHTMLHEDMRTFTNDFPRDAHPMAILSSALGALSTFYQDSLDPRDPQQVEESLLRLIAKLPTIAAYSYKKAFGQPFIYPDNSLDYCSNFFKDDVCVAKRAVRCRS